MLVTQVSRFAITILVLAVNALALSLVHAACTQDCAYGYCWKNGSECYETHVQIANANVYWKQTADGNAADTNAAISYDQVQYCTKECAANTQSRAHSGPLFDVSTCSGNVIATWENIWMTTRCYNIYVA